MKIDGVEVKGEGFSREELENYVAYTKEKVPGVTKIEVKLSADGMVDIDYFAPQTKFERIRRITGYLVGTIDRWNDAKQAEEHDRVKHEVTL